MKNNLWILTEERPKGNVLNIILQLVEDVVSDTIVVGNLRIIPLIDKDGRFLFQYEVLGVDCKHFQKVFLRIVSGKSSFVDYLVFLGENAPVDGEKPLLAIEETKTDDAESRNTGIFQRATKFVYLDLFFPDVKKVMLYNLQVGQKKKATATNIFGTRCFKTLGVEILGKEISDEEVTRFDSVEELIEARSKIKPTKNGVSIQITQSIDVLKISCRLFKSKGLSHDPNIGTISLIAGALRELGWVGRIVVTLHGLKQSHVRGKNKFIQIANLLGIELEGLEMVSAITPDIYWAYESKGEKIASIFMHLLVDGHSPGSIIYENHAGCERGYFYCPDGSPLAITKTEVSLDEKSTTERQKIPLPDLILIDHVNNLAISVEGEMAQNMKKGVVQLAGFGKIEKNYISKYYPELTLQRSIVLFGGTEMELDDKVSLWLKSDGTVVLGPAAHQIVVDSITRLKNEGNVSA